MWLWTSYFTFLSFVLFIYKMGVILTHYLIELLGE